MKKIKKTKIRTLKRKENGKIIVEKVNIENRKILEKFVIDSQGRKNGLYQRFNYSGSIIEEGEYKNDEKEGMFVKKNKKNEPLLRVDYKKGLKHGVYQSYWHSSNRLCEESNWNNGFIEGDYKIYDELTGKLKYHREYGNEKLIQDFLKDKDKEKKDKKVKNK